MLLYCALLLPFPCFVPDFSPLDFSLLDFSPAGFLAYSPSSLFTPVPS
jgi:hypothetical protein